MPRKTHTDKPIEAKVNIPTTVFAKVNLLLFDPVRGHRKYGEFSKLVTELLQKWLREQEKEKDND